MKKLHAPNGNRQKAKYLFALLLSTGILLGCQNMLQTPETGMGTLSLTINERGTERTILPPGISAGDFSRFDLKFIARTSGNTDISKPNWVSGPMELPAGTWDLYVTAFRDGEPSAQGRLEIVVRPNELTTGNVMLSPIPGSGYGTFSWDIRFNPVGLRDNLMLVRMYINLLDEWGNIDYWDWKILDYINEGVRPPGGTEVTNPGSYAMLPTGQYGVVFVLYNDQGERAEVSEMLHVYRNMTSHSERTFGYEHFPVSLQNFILSAWNGTSWDFASRGIEAGHFSLLDINGVYEYNFDDIVLLFNELQLQASTVLGDPTCCCHLRSLVDAALIGMARDEGRFYDRSYQHRVEAEMYIVSVVQNGSHVSSFSWIDDHTVDVILIWYVVRITFNDAIQPLQPGYLGERLAYLRGNAQDGGFYEIIIGGDEEITSSMAMLPSSRGDITITLRGSVPSTVSLLGHGALFGIGHGVILVLGENITLQGWNRNNAPLIRILYGGSLVMDDGASIMGNTNTLGDGGGVQVNGGVFTMNAGTISGNSTSSSGGGVSIAGELGTFNMYGGTISGNTASRGGGVYNVGTFNMRGGSISGNTADCCCGGGGIRNRGTFNISDGIIHGINATSGLENIANDGAAFRNCCYGIAQYGIFNGYSFAPLGYLNTTNLTVEVINGVREIPQRGGGIVTQLSWLREFAQDNNSYYIDVNGNEVIAPQSLPVGRNGLTIILRGNTPSTISLSTNGSLFTVGDYGPCCCNDWNVSGVTLVLDNNITLQGRGGNNSPLVRVLYAGTLVMKEGARIIDNANIDTEGGGVRVSYGGTFIMYGGEISGNTNASDWNNGGAVFNQGAFDMRGGVISANTATSGDLGAGGVFNQGIFRISSGVIYGTDAEEELRNTSSPGMAVLVNWGGAEYGVFSNEYFSPFGSLNNTNYTLNMVDGVRQGLLLRLIDLTPGSGNFLGVVAATGVPSTALVTYSGEFMELRIGSNQPIHGLDLLLGPHTGLPNVAALSTMGLVTLGNTYTISVEGHAATLPSGDVEVAAWPAGYPGSRVTLTAGELDFNLELEFTPQDGNYYGRVRILIADTMTTLILTSVVVANASGDAVWSLADVLTCPDGML